MISAKSLSINATLLPDIK